MSGVMQVVIVLAVVVVGIVLWFALEPPLARPGYVERSPNGSTKPRWRVR